MRKCKVCREPFEPTRPMQSVCGHGCALAMASTKRQNDAKAAQTAEKKADRAKREKMKTRGEWLVEAKKAIQRFRRLEEISNGEGCISCGRSQGEVQGSDGWKPGGAWDGGHFLSKGARPELALEPLNIWLQCKTCNAGSGKYARKGYTVNASFRENLISRIGMEKVEWLEGPHQPKHYSVEDLKDIKAKYTEAARMLKKKIDSG